MRFRWLGYFVYLYLGVIVMNVKFVCVGSVKEKYFREALDEYYKRLTKFINLKVVEVKEEKLLKKPSPAEIEYVVEQESLRIISQLEGYVILCSPTGKNFSSIDFAKNLKKVESNFSTITFVVGGSYGVSDKMIRRANISLTFGSFTFPHQLFRVMLAEQVYRAYTIINHITYHK